MDEPSTSLQVHLDTLEYTRQGLRTRTPLDLTTGRHNRVHLIRPKLATVSLAAQHGFALDRAFPLPATLALLWAYRPADSPLPAAEIQPGPKGTLQIFGHADASGDDAHNKTLSERRAAVILALLQSDVDAMLSLADGDGWTPWEYQVLLRVLGSDPGPTDGDPGPLTDLALAHFAQRYVAGFFHPRGTPRLPDLDAHAFDAPTVEALLDAFVSAHAPDLSGCTLHTLRPTVGCSEFNPLTAEGGSHNRRVSMLAALDDPHPENAPCTQGDANACAVVGEGPYTCMWYREHVAAEPTQAAAFYDPRWLERDDGSYVLSVLTNLPDDAPVVFDVFGHDKPLPKTSPFEDRGNPWSEPLATMSVGGLATTTWAPPADVTPGADDGPVPVFRTSTASRDAHLWATWSDIVGVQLLDDAGRCFANASITLEAPSGTHALTTDAKGIAWIRDRSDGPLSLTLPEDLLLPHPRDTVTVSSARTTADVPTARADVVALRSGSITRLRVQPPEAALGTISCHFDEGSVYPADTLVALVQQARDALEVDPDARLALFAHTRGSGSLDDDKALSDRRARFVHAVLTADLAALQSVVDEDSWQETHFVSLAHFLGYESDDPRSLFASFQWGYSAGHHHASDLDLGEGKIDATGELDVPTRHALLDAFLATVGTSLPDSAFAPTPCMGCGSFNPPPDGDHPDRLTLAVFPPDRIPSAVPCREGDAAACHVEEAGGCRFFAERVEETSLRYRWLNNAPGEEEDVLYMGARVLVHQGARVAAAVYRAPASVEDVSYAFSSPSAPSPTPPPTRQAIRVHLTSPTDTISGRLRKARLVPRDQAPDGKHVRPMGSTPKSLSLDEAFLDFWGTAFEVLSQTAARPTRDQLRTLRDDLDASLAKGEPVSKPDTPEFGPVADLSPEEFHTLTLTSSMVAAGQALNPFESKRYARDFLRFACNIYATDLVNLLPHGAWIPKVQFVFPKAVQGKPSSAATAKLFEVGPSGVNDFLNGRTPGGTEYGWHRLPGDKDSRSERRAARVEAQRLANRGDLVVLSGGVDPDIGGAGHVAVVMPELAFLNKAQKRRLAHTREGTREHLWDHDKEQQEPAHRRALRSQAGVVNGHGIRGGTLVMGSDHEFLTPGYFRYDPTTDKSRGHDVLRTTR